MEPIYVRVHHGKTYTVDGHHRYAVFKNLGYDRVPIKYVHKTQLGKVLPNGVYIRNLDALLDGAAISN